MDDQLTCPCYLDASAMVKLVVDEDGSEALRTFFQEWPVFLATSICIGEALGVLKSKYLFRKEITEKNYHSACFDLVTRAYSDQTSIEVDDIDVGDIAVFHEVQCIAERHSLDFADALQIVTVQTGKYQCFAGAHAPMLITADGALAEAARAEGVRVWDVCSEDPPPTPQRWR